MGWIAGVLAAAVFATQGDGAPSTSAGPPAREPVEYNRDIRAIFSDHCYQCHGPDAGKRKAGLRLDQESSATRAREGVRAVVPGDLDSSELYQRITAKDASERMPPAKSGKPLTTGQIDLIRRWISEGAKWQPPWAFVPPRRSNSPNVRTRALVRNPIDAFIQARLEQEGLTPNAEADRGILIRRVTLDLIGLPPTHAEIDAFDRDNAPDAFEKVVDRLLASPRLGERLAIRWLNAARYADTNGYQTDAPRFMWRWRDWVIDAANRNQPFDRFTIEQLAGDMLPGSTLDQKLASGFNRNHRGNGEGGIIPEEYAVEYVVDRVDTTATVWLGLTIACARCHSHKFDLAGGVLQLLRPLP
jgi:mono/diheme cytochrome c family protein